MLDVFLPNEIEAMAISKQPTVDASLNYFATQGPVLTVVKVGANGVRAIEAGSLQQWSQPCFATTMVDATGAGDAFNAGFLYAWTKDRSNVQRALCWGSAVASHCVRRVGACSDLAPLSEITKLIDQRRDFMSE